MDINQLIHALNAENLIERIAYRRQAGPGGHKQFVKLKGTRQQLEHKVQPSARQNPNVGFKCLHYSVTESSGFVEVAIVKKVNEEMVFLVRTLDDTAKAPEDYTALHQMVSMQKHEKEKIIQIKIHDDDIWEPDKDFFIEICSESQKRLDGDDTRTRITILDEDNPGVLGFEEKHIQVRKKDKYAYIRVMRTDGADGDIQCMCRTEVLKDITNQATEFTDFLPIEEKLKFAHQENEKMVKIELFQTATI